MGNHLHPTDAAPSYEETFNSHPVNQGPMPSSSGAYIPLSTTDPDHSHSHTIDLDFGPSIEPGLPLEPVGAPGHVHCEICDAKEDARARRHSSQVNCHQVAKVFIMMSFFASVTGLVAVIRFSR